MGRGLLLARSTTRVMSGDLWPKRYSKPSVRTLSRISYLIEAPYSCQHHAVLEFLHIVAMALHNGRVPRRIVRTILIRLQLQRSLRQVLQFEFRRCLRAPSELQMCWNWGCDASRRAEGMVTYGPVDATAIGGNGIRLGNKSGTTQGQLRQTQPIDAHGIAGCGGCSEEVPGDAAESKLCALRLPSPLQKDLRLFLPTSVNSPLLLPLSLPPSRESSCSQDNVPGL